LNFRRNSKLHRLKLGFLKYKADVRLKNPDALFKNYPLHEFLEKRRRYRFIPNYSDNIEYFKTLEEHDFCNRLYCFDTNDIEVPEHFSLVDNYDDSLDFLKRLFNLLYFETVDEVVINYGKCNEIDVSASLVMDIILADFINYFNACEQARKPAKIEAIRTSNNDKYEIKKILYSVGAYKNLRNESQVFRGAIPFAIRIGDRNKSDYQVRRDLHTTETVDYIKECLGKVNRTLTDQAETKFYKVIGEMLLNSEDHSGRQMRYLIGHFEDNGDEQNEAGYGVFNLSILNFGNTIYETFKSPNAPKRIVRQMEKLSGTFSFKNFFKKRKFEEETLWTLYALQEGVTSVNHRERGNGAIQFIENFFGLKGNSERDEVSKMVIISGHTRIIFDGGYQITKGIRGKHGNEFKMMTFNESGSIEDLPDEKYVMYEENYFPGTMISVRLKLDYENTTDLTLKGDDESND